MWDDADEVFALAFSRTVRVVVAQLLQTALLLVVRIPEETFNDKVKIRSSQQSSLIVKFLTRLKFFFNNTKTRSNILNLYLLDRRTAPCVRRLCIRRSSRRRWVSCKCPRSDGRRRGRSSSSRRACTSAPGHSPWKLESTYQT